MTERLALSAKEAAQLLGVGESTVRKHCNNGDIPHRRLGDRILIPRDALTAWLHGQAAS